MLPYAIMSRESTCGNHVPQVMPCVISHMHEGEFSEPLIKTIEAITTHWKHYVQGHTECFQTGEPLGKKSTMFRGDLKDRLMCVTANGFGLSDPSLKQAS